MARSGRGRRRDDRAEGWSKVDRVITAGFGFFAENPDFVRIVRREALDGGSHLGVDLGAALRPCFERAVAYFAREMAPGTFRTRRPRAAAAHRLRRPAQLLQRRPVPRGAARTGTRSPTALEARLEHILQLFHLALDPVA